MSSGKRQPFCLDLNVLRIEVPIGQGIIDPGDGLLPVLCQALTWINADLLSIRLMNILLWIMNQNWIIFSQEKGFKMQFTKYQPFCLDNMLIQEPIPM